VLTYKSFIRGERQPLLGYGSANTPVARQWLSSRHVVSLVTREYVILEALFSVTSVPRLYNNEDQLPHQSLNLAVVQLTTVQVTELPS
jgi:hypothetical protein